MIKIAENACFKKAYMVKENMENEFGIYVVVCLQIKGAIGNDSRFIC